MSRRLVRSIRNINSTPAEVKIKSATSNDSFGPTTSQLNEIALLSLQEKPLQIILQVLKKRINDGSKNWRHVLKSLTVIHYVLVVGSLQFVNWFKSNKHLITTLKEYQLKGNDEVAQQIITKARSISKLLSNDNLLNEKRSQFHVFRNKMSQPSLDKRSSLDISRDDVNLATDVIPLNVQRGSQSLDIRRSFDEENLPSSKLYSHTNTSKILADITEE